MGYSVNYCDESLLLGSTEEALGCLFLLLRLAVHTNLGIWTSHNTQIQAEEPSALRREPTHHMHSGPTSAIGQLSIWVVALSLQSTVASTMRVQTLHQ